MRRSRLAVAAMLLASMTCGMLTGCGEESKYEKPLDSATAEEVGQIAASDERLTGDVVVECCECDEVDVGCVEHELNAHQNYDRVGFCEYTICSDYEQDRCEDEEILHRDHSSTSSFEITTPPTIAPNIRTAKGIRTNPYCSNIAYGRLFSFRLPSAS